LGSEFKVIAWLVAIFFLVSFLLWVRKVSSRHLQILLVWGMLYPIGKGLQFSLIGPDWARWYLADISFLACVAGTFLIQPIGSLRWRLAMVRFNVILVWVAICALEVLFELSQTDDPSILARGDWWDIVCYTASLPLVWVLINGVRVRFVRVVIPQPVPVRVTSERNLELRRTRKGNKRRRKARRWKSYGPFLFLYSSVDSHARSIYNHPRSGACILKQ